MGGEATVERVRAQVERVCQRVHRKVPADDPILGRQHFFDERPAPNRKAGEVRRSLQRLPAFALRVTARRHGGSKTGDKHWMKASRPAESRNKGGYYPF